MNIPNISGLGVTALITTGFATVTMAWGHLQGFFARMRSFVIVQATVGGQARQALEFYLQTNFKNSNLRTRNFYANNYYVNTKSRVGTVAFELGSKGSTYWQGFRPIFAGITDSSMGGDYSISFIRGTYDIDKLIFSAAEALDTELHSGNSINDRFRIVKFFGQSGNEKSGSLSDSNNGAKDSQVSTRSESVSTPDPNFRLVGYDRSQIGQLNSAAEISKLQYSEEVKAFKREVLRWFKSKNWFEERSIPWRFGGGLFGPPGTGKTSFVRAIGQELDMPIHVYDLTTMSNKELVAYWDKSLQSSPCIVLFEDIDRIFDKDRAIKTSMHKDPLTLDCLLNCICGVQAADGILTLVTANDMSKVDPALGVSDASGMSTRPGRLDRAVFFGVLSETDRTAIAARILSGFEELIGQVVEDGKGESGAQFESRCAKIALEQFHKNSEMEK